MMDLELTQKRVEFINTMKESLVDMDMEGNEVKFFSSKFLVQKYLQYSAADLALNEKLKKEEIDELNLAGDPDNAPSESLIDQIANLLESKEDKIETIKKVIKKRKKKVKDHCDDILNDENHPDDEE